MQKWFRIIRAFGPYRCGEWIAPVGLQRDRLIFNHYVDREFMLSERRPEFSPAQPHRAVAPAPETRVAVAPEPEAQPVEDSETPATNHQPERVNRRKPGRPRKWK